MSAVTLETLRADCIAKYNSLAEREGGTMFDDATDRELASVALNKRQSKTLWDETYRPAKVAATLYHLAREYGVQAAVLYKLSDGSIDPRGAA